MKAMKKIFTFLAAAAALLAAAASCNKIENDGPETQGIRIHVNVADYDAATKAVKTGWAAGDKINVWFDGVSVQTPHLVLTYNGSAWSAGALDPTAAAALKTDGTGTFKYLYEGGNDISAYTFNFGFQYSFPYGTIGTKDFFAPALTLCSPDTDPNYTYDGTDLTLNLSDWCFITNAQVVVTGLTGSPEDWYLSVKSGSAEDWYSIQDFRNSSGTPGFTYGNSGSETTATRGTTNADGVAFYLRLKSSEFYNVNITSPYSDHTFTLGNATTSYNFTKENTPITSAYATANPGATNKQKLNHTFTAIKIAFSSFSAI